MLLAAESVTLAIATFAKWRLGGAVNSVTVSGPTYEFLKLNIRNC